MYFGFGFDLDLIWIEIGVFKNFKECARSPCNGNHFSCIFIYVCLSWSKKRRRITWAKRATHESCQTDDFHSVQVH